MAQFFTFTPKRKEDGAIDFYTLMDVFDERKEDGTTSPAGHGERKIKFNDMKVLIATKNQGKMTGYPRFSEIKSFYLWAFYVIMM